MLFNATLQGPVIVVYCTEKIYVQRWIKLLAETFFELSIFFERKIPVISGSSSGS